MLPVDLSPTLPLNDINVLILTDTHSWVGGHGPNEPHLDADYGDVLSFYERLSDYCEEAEKDLYFVVNGDWVDGTGISLNGDVFSLTQVLEKMPWDAVNIGNHELYHPELIDFIVQPGGFVDWWGDKYLSSNIDLVETGQPIGNHYVVMRGQRTSLLTFGFLYNMQNHVGSVTVNQVETVVKEQWFQDALLKEEYDAILVLAHMHYQDPLVTVIRTEIRNVVGKEMPVQFVTGHTHIRNYADLDPFSASFEAGKFLDTVGFVSFPTHTSLSQNTGGGGASITGVNASIFEHRFLDANREVLREAVGSPKLDTPNGLELSAFIDTVRRKLGLEEEVGCVEQTYYRENATSKSSSLWGMFQRDLVPTMFTDESVLFIEKGGLRYDLVGGRLQLDDVIVVSPFNDTLFSWDSIPGRVILDLNVSMNENGDQSWLQELPQFILAPGGGPIDENSTYRLVTAEFELEDVRKGLAQAYPESADRTPQPLSQTTQTSIWVDFIREHRPCDPKTGDDTTDKQQAGQNIGHPYNHPNRHNKTHTGVSLPNPASEEDSDLLMFATVAIACIVLLGAVNVWQRGRQFRQMTDARETIILEARNEFTIDDDDGGYESNEEDEAEGRFV